jgi:hypothetical protein
MRRAACCHPEPRSIGARDLLFGEGYGKQIPHFGAKRRGSE